MTTTTFDPLRHETRLIARLDSLRTTAGRFPLSLIEFGMTCCSVFGCSPLGCHTLTEKISELRRGTSSSTTSIGVFE